MIPLRVLLSRLLGLSARSRRDAELDDEIHTLLDLLADEHMRRGMSPDDARAAARREFGGVEQLKEVYRDERGFPSIDGLAQDVRYAGRTLTKNLGHSTVVVLTLALAIGASAVIVAVVDATRRAVPIEERDRVVYLPSTDSKRGRDRTGVSVPDFADWAAQNSSFEELAALEIGSSNWSGVEPPVRLSAIRASANLFPLWGVRPSLGRTFATDEDRPGGERVVLLSDSFWQRRFAGGSDVLGKTLTLDRETYTVIGVLPPQLGALSQMADVWVPLAPDVTRASRDRRTLSVTGRLKSTVSVEQAGLDMAAVARRLETQHPTTNSGIGILVRPVIEMSGGASVRFVMLLLSLVAGLLVLIACANVANIILARYASRQREFALRAAIGASRFRLIRQVMVEALLSSFLAAAIGLMFATWGLALLRALAGSNLLFFSGMTISRRVVEFGAIAAFVTPFVFAFWPATQAFAGNLGEVLAREGRTLTGGRRGARHRALLVVGQVALTFALAIEIGLLVQTALGFRNAENGFEPHNLLTLRLDLPASTYTEPYQINDFFDRLLSRIEPLPGVQSAATTTSLPVADTETRALFAIEGDPRPSAEGQPWAALSAVSPTYLRTMRIPLFEGRDLAETDSAATPPVALISRVMARRYWPNDNPIGKRIRFNDGHAPVEIIGVVGDVRNSDPDAGLMPQVYIPSSQRLERVRAIVVRTEGVDSTALTGAIRSEVSILDKDLPIYGVSSMEQVLFDDLGGTYLMVGILAILALIALGLAAGGIYGVVSYSVTQRTREFGIRMALGAQPQAVLQMVLTQGFGPILIGALLGLSGGFALALTTSAALREVNPTAPLTYAGVAILLGVVTLLASYVPARRVFHVDPVVALRHE